VELHKWITDWFLLGPLELEESTNEVEHLGGFENDFISEHGGITNPQIEIGQVETSGNSNATWTEYSSPDSIINLDEAISKQSYVAAYAYKEIYTEEDGTFILSLGTNDGGKLWVNGIEVWDYPGARGLKPDDNFIPVFFQKGKNVILLKVEERGNNWGFCVRVLPFNIDAFMIRGKLFNIVTTPNGNSELRFALSDQVVNNLFSSIDLEIYSDDRDTKLIWTGEWTKKKIMKLDFESHESKPYLLKIIGERKDGKKWNDKILFNSGKRIDHTLFSNKQTDYKIVVGEDASESEKWAAEELQKTLLEISGADFEIISDRTELTNKEIIVGYNKHSQQLLGDKFVSPALLDESFTYQNINSNIVLIGGKQRGTMYAVFAFLESIFGVRWYTPNVTVIPSREKHIFNYLNHHEAPSIQVRNDFYYEAFNPTWAAHNRINGAMGFREQHGDIEGY